MPVPAPHRRSGSIPTAAAKKPAKQPRIQASKRHKSTNPYHREQSKQIDPMMLDVPLPSEEEMNNAKLRPSLSYAQLAAQVINRKAAPIAVVRTAGGIGWNGYFLFSYHISVYMR